MADRYRTSDSALYSKQILNRRHEDGVMLKTNVAKINPMRLKELVECKNINDRSMTNTSGYTRQQDPPLDFHVTKEMSHSNYEYDQWNNKAADNLHSHRSQSYNKDYYTQNNGNYDKVKLSADAIIKEKDKIIQRQILTIKKLESNLQSPKSISDIEDKLGQFECNQIELLKNKETQISHLQSEIQESHSRLTKTERDCAYYKKKSEQAIQIRDQAMSRQQESDQYICANLPSVEELKQCQLQVESLKRDNKSLCCSKQRLEAELADCSKKCKAREVLISNLQTKIRNQNEFDDNPSSADNWRYKENCLISERDCAKKCAEGLQARLNDCKASASRFEADLKNESDTVIALQLQINDHRNENEKFLVQIKSLGKENTFLNQQLLKALEKVKTSDDNQEASESSYQVQRDIESELRISIHLLDNLVSQSKNIINNEEVDVTSILGLPDIDDDEIPFEKTTETTLKQRLETIRCMRGKIDDFRKFVIDHCVVSMSNNCITQ